MIHIAIMLFCNKTEGYFYIFPCTHANLLMLRLFIF